MKESLDMLILENDEKDKLISELDLEIKEKANDADFAAQNVQIATEEVKERENKLTQMKLERDMKEKEAAAHLATVEEKAKRVDQLES